MSRNKRTAPLREHLLKVKPQTDNQKIAFEEFFQGQNLVLHGLAGTGKTFISMYMAMKELMDSDSPYRHILIVRSAIPSQDLGALPGSYEEKIAPYEEPYDCICDELFPKQANSYDTLKANGFLTFMPVSYIRGITFSDSIIIVDECQNLNFHQLDSVITRVGENSKIIFSGDYTQSDLKRDKEKDGIVKFMDILKDMEAFTHIQFWEDDIVRSKLVKDYIITKHKKGH